MALQIGRRITGISLLERVNIVGLHFSQFQGNLIFSLEFHGLY
jgi:hypothetical protein